MSQMKDLLNMNIKGGSFITKFIDLITNISTIDLPTFYLSIICIQILLVLKYLKSKYKIMKLFPGALLIVIFGTIVSYLTRDCYRFNIIGHLPSGIPAPTNFMSPLTMNAFINLFPSALLVSLVGFIQSYSMAKKCADLRSYNINASQG